MSPELVPGILVPARPAKAPREKPFPRETGRSGLQPAAIERVKLWGGYAWNAHGGVSAQTTGTPDLLGSLGGRALAIELKQPGKQPTDLQWKRLRDWRDAGALAGYVTTIVELDALLEHWDDPTWVNPQFTR